MIARLSYTYVDSEAFAALNITGADESGNSVTNGSHARTKKIPVMPTIRFILGYFLNKLNIFSGGRPMTALSPFTAMGRSMILGNLAIASAIV